MSVISGIKIGKVGKGKRRKLSKRKSKTERKTVSILVGEFQYLASACLSWPVLGISLSHATVIASACYGMLRKHTKKHQAPDCSPLALRSPDICALPSFS